MKRTTLLEELRKMRFKTSYERYKSGGLSQTEAADLLGVCARTFRRYMKRYAQEGLEGLVDKRLIAASNRGAPADEICRLEDLYAKEFMGWNVKHFYAWYQREQAQPRSYTWVKNKLQAAGLVVKSKGKGKHRKRRERSALPGMMIHQDGSTHEWISGVKWDLIVTMDDATNEHYSMCFVEQEGTLSSFMGVKEVIEKQGLFCTFYSDRGSHYWHTPTAGGKVCKAHLTQFGRAMNQLGIQMIAAYSPEARGRSERAFRTHQERLPKELKKAGIKDIKAANQYLSEVYQPAHNAEFKGHATEQGSAFVPYQGLIAHLDEVLCEQHERVVGKDNCVQFETLSLQIPAQTYRMNFIKVRVKVHRYADQSLALFHGPRLLARYDHTGQFIDGNINVAA